MFTKGNNNIFMKIFFYSDISSRYSITSTIVPSQSYPYNIGLPSAGNPTISNQLMPYNEQNARKTPLTADDLTKLYKIPYRPHLPPQATFPNTVITHNPFEHSFKRFILLSENFNCCFLKDFEYSMSNDKSI